MEKITVKELIKTLATCDQDSFVAMSADSEGNSYSIIANEQFVTQNVYMKDEFEKQDQFFEKTEVEDTTDKTVKDFYENQIEKAKLVKCVLLWPCN